MSRVYLSLGSNLGNRYSNLQNALNSLKSLEKTKFIRASRIYDTDPVGRTNQPRFLNCVVEITTSLRPVELLSSVKGIEKELGRNAAARWAERIIDIDILTYDSVTLKTKDLILPHPRITTRRFVLQPLSDLNEQFIIAGQPNTVRELLDEL